MIQLVAKEPTNGVFQSLELIDASSTLISQLVKLLIDHQCLYVKVKKEYLSAGVFKSSVTYTLPMTSSTKSSEIQVSLLEKMKKFFQEKNFTAYRLR